MFDTIDRQLLFTLLIEGKRANTSGLVKGLSGEFPYRLDPHESDRSRKAEVEFCKKTQKHLENSSWSVMIDELMAARSPGE